MIKNSRILILTALFVLLMVGCSSTNNNPTTPVDPDHDLIASIPTTEIDPDQTNRHLLGMWTLTFNPDTMTAEVEFVREVDHHFNVTAWLAPGMNVVINAYDPVTRIVDADVTITNPFFDLAGHDLRAIIFTDLAGNLLMNPDNWTSLWDILGGQDINPFIAYAKDIANRRFGPFYESTESFQIYLGGGPVQFAIDVSWPGNCEEPQDQQFYPRHIV